MCKTWAWGVGIVPLGDGEVGRGVEPAASVACRHSHRRLITGRCGWCSTGVAADFVPVSDNACAAGVGTLRGALA